MNMMLEEDKISWYKFKVCTAILNVVKSTIDSIAKGDEAVVCVHID